MVSSTVGSGILTGPKRLSSAASFSICFLYSSCVCWIDLLPNRPNGLLGALIRALIGGAQPLMVGGPPLHSAKIKGGEGPGHTTRGSSRRQHPHSHSLTLADLERGAGAVGSLTAATINPASSSSAPSTTTPPRPCSCCIARRCPRADLHQRTCDGRLKLLRW